MSVDEYKQYYDEHDVHELIAVARANKISIKAKKELRRYIGKACVDDERIFWRAVFGRSAVSVARREECKRTSVRGRPAGVLAALRTDAADDEIIMRIVPHYIEGGSFESVIRGADKFPGGRRRVERLWHVARKKADAEQENTREP